MQDQIGRVSTLDSRQSPSTVHRAKRRARLADKRSTTVVEPLPPPPPPPPDSSPESTSALRRSASSPGLINAQWDGEGLRLDPGDGENPKRQSGTNELSKLMPSVTSICQSSAAEALTEKRELTDNEREAAEERNSSRREPPLQASGTESPKHSAQVESARVSKGGNCEKTDVRAGDSSQSAQKRPTSLFKPGQSAAFFEDYKRSASHLHQVCQIAGQPFQEKHYEDQATMSGNSHQRLRIQRKRRPLPSIPQETNHRRDVGVMTPDEMFDFGRECPTSTTESMSTMTLRSSVTTPPEKSPCYRPVDSRQGKLGPKCKLLLLIIPTTIVIAISIVLALLLLGFFASAQPTPSDQLTTPKSSQITTSIMQEKHRKNISSSNGTMDLVTLQVTLDPTAQSNFSENSDVDRGDSSDPTSSTRNTETFTRRKQKNKSEKHKRVTTAAPKARHSTTDMAPRSPKQGGGGRRKKGNKNRKNGRRKNKKDRNKNNKRSRSSGSQKTRMSLTPARAISRFTSRSSAGTNREVKKQKASFLKRKDSDVRIENRVPSIPYLEAESDLRSREVIFGSQNQRGMVDNGFPDDETLSEAGSGDHVFSSDDEDDDEHIRIEEEMISDRSPAGDGEATQSQRCMLITNPICDAVLPYRYAFVAAKSDIAQSVMTSLVLNVVGNNQTTCDPEEAIRFRCALQYPKCEDGKESSILREFPCREWCSQLVTSCLDNDSAVLVRALQYGDRNNDVSDQTMGEFQATERREAARLRKSFQTDLSLLASYACDVILHDELVITSSIERSCVDLSSIETFFQTQDTNLTSTARTPTCGEGEFLCLDDECIDGRWLCDGINDCGSGEDERDCVAACSYDEFQCTSGQCIEQSRNCDGFHDCVDRSDETNCGSCAVNLTPCGNGQCILNAWWCDGDVDCDNGMDEAKCDCSSRGLVSCGNYTCIPLSYQCDGESDCDEADDERGCHRKGSQHCSTWEMLCDNTCVATSKQCDGARDCRDGSDEANCGPCEEISLEACHQMHYNVTMMPNLLGHASQTKIAINADYVMFATVLHTRCHPFLSNLGCAIFVPPVGAAACSASTTRTERLLPCRSFCDEIRSTCSSVLHSVSLSWPKFLDCDGFPLYTNESKCYDPRSATKASCGIDQFECINSSHEETQCISTSYKCDGIKHCADGSDEVGCDCKDLHKFKCATTNQCIPLSWQCDTHIDCEDESDEMNCAKCAPNEKACANYSCVSKRQWCDGIADCEDGSDESDCVRLVPRGYLQQAVTIPQKTRISGVLIGYNGETSQWQPVCSQSWNPLMSHLACSQMGFKEAISFSRILTFSPFLRRSVLRNRLLMTSRDHRVRTVQEAFIQSQHTCRSERLIHIKCTPRRCGQRRDVTDSGKIATRILGGRTSRDHAWPWLVSLSLPGMDHVCGATLVRRQWLISAAHCFQERTDIGIWSARISLDGENALKTSVPFNVSRIIMHPRYNPRAVDFDIALVKLSTPVDNGLATLCLPNMPFSSGSFCVIAGWGVNGRTRGGARKLQEGSVHVVDRASCQGYYPNHVITNRMLCAGKAGIVDACSGDSGGPLMCWQSDVMQWQLAGVTSWGSSCKPHSAPGVYTDVQYFARWAERTMEQKEFG